MKERNKRKKKSNKTPQKRRKKGVIIVKKTVLKKESRFLIVFLMFIFLAAGMNLIFKSLNLKNDSLREPIYLYKMDQDLDYAVYLYDNSFIQKEFLNKSQTYILDLVKSIELSYKFDYSGSKIVPVKYTFEINGTIYGDYQANSQTEVTNLWKKTYSLINPETKLITNNKIFNIERNLSLDLSQFSKEVDEFKKQLSLPISAYLKLDITVKIEGLVDDSAIVEEKITTVKVPLSQQVFQITEDYEKTLTKTVYPKVEDANAIDFQLTVLGIILVFIPIIILILFYKVIFNIIPKSFYVRTITKIFKEYDDVIVEVVSPISEDNLNLVLVKNFKEMIDLEEEIRIPIMFYEVVKDEVGEFVIVNDNIVYKYILENIEE